MTGTAKNGKKFKGTYAIDRFTSRGGKLYAVGTLKGKLKGRNVKRSNVRIPATLARHESAGASQLPNPTPGACQVLDLVLNPIDLNLLGLRVATSRIEAPDRGDPRRREPARQPAVRDHRHPRPAGRHAGLDVAARAGPQRAARAGAPHRLAESAVPLRPCGGAGRYLRRFVRIFSGIQPTGSKHLGNYIGAIVQYVAGQERGDPAIYCIVDLHAITVDYDPVELRRARLRHDRDPDRRGPRPRALHPVPPERRPGAQRSCRGCCRA